MKAKRRLEPERVREKVVEGGEVKGTRKRWRDQRASSGPHYWG